MAMSMTMSMCNKLTVADSNSSIRRVDLRSNHLPIETERFCQFCKRFRKAIILGLLCTTVLLVINPQTNVYCGILYKQTMLPSFICNIRWVVWILVKIQYFINHFSSQNKRKCFERPDILNSTCAPVSMNCGYNVIYSGRGRNCAFAQTVHSCFKAQNSSKVRFSVAHFTCTNIYGICLHAVLFTVFVMKILYANIIMFFVT